jgi:hypothetical protein
MTLEETLSGWTGPSSTTEQEKQERTERMVREAVAAHRAFAGCSLGVYAKGSYPNNTNVQADSDVDIGVQCHDAMYWDQEAGANRSAGTPYGGPWTPSKLRAELTAALKTMFGEQVDTSGMTAIRVNSTTARVDADVVPCFDYRHYFASGGHRDGARIFRENGGHIENWPVQHLEKGRAKNTDTSTRFKQAVRVLKRTENAMVTVGKHREVPSFFVECLVYNCPDWLFFEATWTDRIRRILGHIWEGTQGDVEPATPDRWLEVNRCKYLFGPHQGWSRKDGRDFAKAAWNYLGYA